MSRFVLGILTLLLFAGDRVAPAVQARGPNIVVIVADDYVSAPYCSPTRAGFLTGRYQQRFGHEFNVAPTSPETAGLPLTETTLASRLKSAGYRTVVFGKWHQGSAARCHPMERGFDEYFAFNAVHVPLQVADAYLKRFAHLPEGNRRTYAAKWQLDGVNLLPFLTEQLTAPPHDALYWRLGGMMARRRTWRRPSRGRSRS